MSYVLKSIGLWPAKQWFVSEKPLVCGHECNDIADYRFFFKVISNIHESYPIVFKGKGASRPHSQGYRDFAEKWGAIKTLYEVCDEKIEKVGEVYQYYLADYLQFLSYLIDKGEADRAEDEFQELRRKATKGRH